MTKIKKIFLIFICIFFTVCLISNKSYSYSLKQVRKIIDFNIVDEYSEPKDYDILIDATDFIENEKLPCIQTSIDTVLYSSEGLLDINFFNDNSSNISGTWNKISEIVRNFFRVFLYVAMAAMLTVLIYIGVVLVVTSISKKETILPLGNILRGGKGDTPKKYLVEKRFLEQWISTVIILALLVYIINLIISCSGFVTNVFEDSRIKEEDKPITVYVKNAKEVVEESDIESIGTNNSLSEEIEDYIANSAASGKWAVYAKNLTDHKFVLAYNNGERMPSDSIIKLFIAVAAYEKQENEEYYKVDENDMKAMITMGDNEAANRFIDSIGGIKAVNSYIAKKGYSNTKLNRRFGTTGFERDNYTCAEEVGALLELIYNGQCAGSNEILNYMKEQKRRRMIPQGVSDNGTEVANMAEELGTNYQNGPIESDAAIIYKENANYVLVMLSSNLSNAEQAATNIKEISSTIYDNIEDISNKENNSQNNNTPIMKTNKINYYFKTNLEGLLMFQSQHDWEKHSIINVVSIIGGFAITLFKIFLYFVFVIRMVVVALLITLSPIVILINAFMRINGNEGLLKGWLKLFLYFVFLRPIISIIYYILARSNVNLVSEHPLYMLVVIAVITVLLVLSFKKMYSNFKSTKQRNAANRNL